MVKQILQVALVAALAASLIWAPACSVARDKQEDNAADTRLDDDIAAVLESVPSETVTRFILTVKPAKDAKIIREQVNSVIEALRSAGAKAEWLEGSPVIFVTCYKAAIYEAIETGYVATVQVDQLRKPMD